jgi:hypothetical protein
MHVCFLKFITAKIQIILNDIANKMLEQTILTTSAVLKIGAHKTKPNN